MEKTQNRQEARKLAITLLSSYKKELFLGFLSLILVDIADVLPPYIIKLAIDGIEAGKPLNYLLMLGAAILGLAILQGTFRFFIRKFFLGSSHCAVYDLRKQLFEHLLKLPFDFFNKTRTGDLMSRLTNDLQEIRFMLGIGVLIMFDISFYFLSIPFFMLWLSPKLTLISCLPLCLLPVLVLVIRHHIHSRSMAVQSRLSELSAVSEESISGMKISKGFRTESNIIDKINTVSMKLFGDKLKLASLEAFFHPTLNLIIHISTVVLLLFGGKMVIAGTITLGSFVAMKAYLTKLSWPMFAIGWVVNLYQKGMASLERCNQTFDENRREVVLEDEPIANRVIQADVQFKNITYRYPEASIRAVDNISFKIQAGSTLGITGPIGCGKTTLLRLLMKIMEPESGEIFISGESILKIPTEVLKQTFSYVPQDSFLFSESIRENILFTHLDKENEQSAMNYAEIAGLSKDIDSFKDGLDTILGERGVNLSGGQKQRVALARALAAKASIVVLDDCTSAVDTATEQKILQNLNSENTNRTCIIVSHRLASIQSADVIIYMEDGKICENGSHASLIASNGKYASLWAKQRIEQDLEGDA